MLRFADVAELARVLPGLAVAENAWLYASRDAWLTRPATTPCYVFEPEDDPAWVENVCGVLGLDPMLPVSLALEVLPLASPEREEDLVTYALLYLWK